MTHDFVADLEARGAVLALEGGEVKVKATKGLLTTQDRAKLLAFKPDIAHLLLERQAAAVFPGAVVVDRADYLEFKHRLLADIFAKWIRASERWHNFWLCISAGLTEPEPLPTWCRRLADERMSLYVAYQDENLAADLQAGGAHQAAEEAA